MKTILNYTMSSKPAQATWDPFLNSQGGVTQERKGQGKEYHILARFSLYSYIISHNLCLAGMVILLHNLGSWVRAGQVIRVQEKYSANCKQADDLGWRGAFQRIPCSKSSWLQTPLWLSSTSQHLSWPELQQGLASTQYVAEIDLDLVIFLTPPPLC